MINVKVDITDSQLESAEKNRQEKRELGLKTVNYYKFSHVLHKIQRH